MKSLDQRSKTRAKISGTIAKTFCMKKVKTG